MSALVSVVMGSRSDWQTMKHVADTLAAMKISHEVRIVSAWRTYDQHVKYVKSAEDRGVKVIVASLGGAVNLPAVLASKTHIPVLAVPLESKTRNSKDTVISMLQMPAGVPVRTFARGRTGAVNSALLAASMLANENDKIRRALVDYRGQQFIQPFHSVKSSIAI